MPFFKAVTLFFAFSFFVSINVWAQTTRKLSGSVTDSTKNPISAVNILLISGTDTLKGISDKGGKFDFKGIKTAKISLNISIMGYDTFTANYTLLDKTNTLNPISLKISSTFLKEVVIKGKPQSMRILKDTLEFNAAAYNVLEDDRVTELLKQLPGVEVDDENNVTTMGKEMTKLRVNGKDFFTNNVKEFIGQLPANIVAKIQIIDDYGDQANFTGIRMDEPKKMLNIVTKPGMNKGVFGNIGLNGGTNNRLGAQGSANIWNENKQIGGNANASQSDNGAGQSKEKSISASYRDNFGKKLNGGFNYYLSNDKNDSENIAFIETVNELGTIYNNTESKGSSGNTVHNLNLSLQKSGEKNFLNVNANASFSNNDNISSSSAKQAGIIKQDLNNENNSLGRSPNVNVNVSWSKRFAKKGRSISLNITANKANRSSEEKINSNILYYDPITAALVKDSVLNRYVDSKNNNTGGSLSINYNHPLKQPKDSLARRSLNLGYSFSIGNLDNTVLTYVTDLANQLSYVDSLSTIYQSLSISQNANINYTFSNQKINYNLGINARPVTLIGNYENIDTKIRNTAFNYSPSFNFSYRISQAKSLSMRYNGNSNSPGANQLQPVRNTQNLQNVIIGNPNLKPSFNHSFNASYNYVHAKSGRSFQAGLSASAIQNQIVSNVILIRDTLNSLKQETRYENANGSYNINGNYNLAIPFVKNKYNISFRGSFGYVNMISFTDNVKYFNKGINFSQAITSGISLKKYAANASISYNFNTNSYTLIKENPRNIETWNFNLSSRATVFKTYKVGITASKRINSGYVLSNTNPTIIGASLSKVLFKKRSLSLNAQVYDLLNQGNNLSRNIVGNSVIDSRTNQLTRFFTFGLSYNLQKFGDK